MSTEAAVRRVGVVATEAATAAKEAVAVAVAKEAANKAAAAIEAASAVMEFDIQPSVGLRR